MKIAKKTPSVQAVERPFKTFRRFKKAALGEADYKNQVRVQIPVPGQKHEFDLVWVRIKTGNKNAGTGALDHLPRRCPGFKLGQVIRFSRKGNAEFADYVPQRVHAANQVSVFLQELCADLKGALTFNPALRR